LSLLTERQEICHLAGAGALNLENLRPCSEAHFSLYQ
jgi:hypothetical protein